MEDETGAVAVRAGDRPRPDADHLGVTLLLSGLTALPRIDDLEQRTREYLENRDVDHDTDLSVE